tara:strand:+ start:865 stop:1092 length:228 start_codon:yes stop_codon:yes gene_type:complete
MIQIPKEPSGFVHSQRMAWGVLQKHCIEMAQNAGVATVCATKSTPSSPHPALYVRGFHKNILGFSLKRKAHYECR